MKAKGAVSARLLLLVVTTKEMDTLMNKKSGVLGISGVSSDFRDLGQAAAEGNERAQLALDMFHYQVRKEIGAFAAAMGGVPVITMDCGELNARKVGEMFYFLELCCGVSAYILGVNPFNQPGVELYKRNMFQLLGKPGYEK